MRRTKQNYRERLGVDLGEKDEDFSPLDIYLKAESSGGNYAQW
jgi:hypothetical protein